MGEQCSVIEPLLSAWLDGELDEAEGVTVEAHLAGCPPCARVLEDCAEVSSLLSNLPARRAPVPVAPPVEDTVDAWHPALRRVQALAVATGLLVVAAFAMGSGPPVDGEAPQPTDSFVADQFGQTLRGHTTLFFRSHPSTSLVVEPAP